MDTTALTGFLESPSGVALKALLVGTLITALLGIFAALRDGTFAWPLVDSFVRSTIWGRVAPVATILIVGYVLDDPTVNGAAIVIATAVAVGLISSALDSIRQLASPKDESAKVNAPPQG